MPRIAPKMKDSKTMATRLTPAASISTLPSLVGTPVMTSAPVMIDSVASKRAKSEIMSVNASRNRTIGSINPRGDR